MVALCTVVALLSFFLSFFFVFDLRFQTILKKAINQSLWTVPLAGCPALKLIGVCVCVQLELP